MVKRNRVKPSSIRPKLKTKAKPKANVIKSKNGKRSTVKAMVGVSDRRMAQNVAFRIGREWYVNVSKTGILTLVFQSRSIRASKIARSYAVKVGKLTLTEGMPDIQFRDLSVDIWADIAFRMFKDSNQIGKVRSALTKAALEHIQKKHSGCPDKIELVRLLK